MEYENNNLDSLEPIVNNMNHAVERDKYADAYNTLLLEELLLPNESADGFIQGTVIKQVKITRGSL